MTNDSIPDDLMHYDEIMAEAMFGVVRTILSRVSEHGLLGAHHYLISFQIGAPGVQISDALRARFHNELTIVLQNKFENLVVDEDYFSVCLYFDGVPENIVIPYSAITRIIDPHAEFGMNFAASSMDDDGDDDNPMPDPDKPKKDTEKRGELVHLDQFRRK